MNLNSRLEVGRRMSVLLILLALISCTSVSYEEHTEAGSKYVLQNGLTVIAKENPDTGMVALDLLVKKGIAQDGDLSGLSHFTNRMLLAGTKTRTRQDIISAIENAGGTILARTYAEYSEIVIEVPSDSVSVALEILQDVVLNPTFDPEELEKERTTILGELESKKDQPAIVAEELFMKTLYKNHPYQHPIDGYTETVLRITREDILRHYTEWYTAQNMILAAAGNVKKEPLLSVTGRLFKKLNTNGKKESIPVPTLHKEPITNNEHMPIESFYIQRGYQLTPATHPDFISLRLMNSILGSGSGSRLFYELRDKRALAYTVYSIAPSIRTIGFIKIAMISRPDAVNKSVEGITEQIERIKNEEVPAEELAVVKQKIRGFFALDHQRTIDQANYLGLYEMQGLGYTYDVEYPDKIDNVTAQDVQRVANMYLTVPVTAVVGPFEEVKIE